MASPSLTYTLTNGTTADASQVMQNFNDLLNGITDGTKDLSISALTVAGTATLNGNINLGNSSADDLAVTASLASDLPIKTNTTYNVGSATKGLLAAYFGGTSTFTAKVAAATHAASRTYTLPDCGADASFIMSQLAQSITGVKTFNDGLKVDDAANQGTLNYFRETSWSAGVSGAISSTITVVGGRIGRFLIIFLPQTFATAGAASTITISGSNLPSEFVPTNSQNAFIAVKDNGNYKSGAALLATSTGNITIGVQGAAGTLQTNFAGSGSTGFEQATLIFTKD